MFGWSKLWVVPLEEERQEEKTGGHDHPPQSSFFHLFQDPNPTSRLSQLTQITELLFKWPYSNWGGRNIYWGEKKSEKLVKKKKKRYLKPLQMVPFKYNGIKQSPSQKGNCWTGYYLTALV